MNTVILYGSMKCPDCPPTIDFLNTNNIPFSFVEILESMENLKIFLTIRDEQDALKSARDGHFVGIPCIFWKKTDQYYLDIELFLEAYFTKDSTSNKIL